MCTHGKEVLGVHYRLFHSHILDLLAHARNTGVCPHFAGRRVDLVKVGGVCVHSAGGVLSVDDGTAVLSMQNQDCSPSIGDFVDVYARIVHDDRSAFLEVNSVIVLDDPDFESLRFMEQIKLYKTCYRNASWSPQSCCAVPGVSLAVQPLGSSESMQVSYDTAQKELGLHTQHLLEAEDLYAYILEHPAGLCVSDLAAHFKASTVLVLQALEQLQLEGLVFCKSERYMPL